MKISKSRTLQINTGCGNIEGTFIDDENGKCEKILLQFGKNGNCYNTRFGDYTHLSNIYIDLRRKIKEAEKLLNENKIDEVKNLIKKIQEKDTLLEIKEGFDGRKCSNSTISGGIQVLSCGDGVAKLIDIYLKDKKKSSK